MDPAAMTHDEFREWRIGQESYVTHSQHSRPTERPQRMWWDLKRWWAKREIGRTSIGAVEHDLAELEDLIASWDRQMDALGAAVKAYAEATDDPWGLPELEERMKAARRQRAKAEEWWLLLDSERHRKLREQELDSRA